MRLRLFHVDAFAPRPFTGNPAAVVPLDGWLPDDTLQASGGELRCELRGDRVLLAGEVRPYLDGMIEL